MVLEKSETKSLEELKLLIGGEETYPDDFLMRFIRGKNYNSKAAFETLQNYKNLRSSNSKYVFTNYGPEKVQHVYASGMIRILKNRDHKSRQVLLMKTESWNPLLISVEDIILAILLICEEMLNSIETQEHGIVIIRDYYGFGFQHMRICTLNEIKKACNIFINSFPCKYKACHVIRNSYFFHLLLSMAKPFMPFKLKRRFFVHGFSMESLHGCLSPDILPEFLGGTLTDENAYDSILEDAVFKINV